MLPPIEKFTSDPTTSFAVVAWSDPLIVRIFYINQYQLATEWTLEGGTWRNTTKTLPKLQGAKAFEPVAASRSVNGSGRYLEYIYSAPGGQINSVGRNSPNTVTFVNPLGHFDIPKPSPGLSTSDKIGLGCGIGIGIPSLCCAAFSLWLGFRGKGQGQEEKFAAPDSSE